MKPASLTPEMIEEATAIAVKRGYEPPLRLLSVGVYGQVMEAIKNGAIPPTCGFYSDLDARFWLFGLKKR
jgi:hypothetical protein